MVIKNFSDRHMGQVQMPVRVYGKSLNLFVSVFVQSLASVLGFATLHNKGEDVGIVIL